MVPPGASVADPPARLNRRFQQETVFILRPPDRTCFCLTEAARAKGGVMRDRGGRRRADDAIAVQRARWGVSRGVEVPGRLRVAARRRKGEAAGKERVEKESAAAAAGALLAPAQRPEKDAPAPAAARAAKAETARLSMGGRGLEARDGRWMGEGAGADERGRRLPRVRNTLALHPEPRLTNAHTPRATTHTALPHPPLSILSSLQKVVRRPPAGIGFPPPRRGLKLQERRPHPFPDLHDRRQVAAPVTVVRGGEDRHDGLVVAPVVALHDQLVRARDEGQTVRVVELVGDVLAKRITRASG